MLHAVGKSIGHSAPELFWNPCLALRCLTLSYFVWPVLLAFVLCRPIDYCLALVVTDTIVAQPRSLPRV
jgi:hypothetical protein